MTRRLGSRVEQVEVSLTTGDITFDKDTGYPILPHDPDIKWEVEFILDETSRDAPVPKSKQDKWIGEYGLTTVHDDLSEGPGFIRSSDGRLIRTWIEHEATNAARQAEDDKRVEEMLASQPMPIPVQPSDYMASEGGPAIEPHWPWDSEEGISQKELDIIASMTLEEKQELARDYD